MKFGRYIVFLAFFTALLPNQIRASQGSLTMDVMGASAASNSVSDHSSAFGFSLFGDWRPVRVISFGAELGYMHLGTWDKTAGYIDLAGRIYPLKPFSFGEAYLQGGLGSNPFHTKDDDWKGQYHGNISAGLRYDLKGNRVLDFGIVTDIFSPQVAPLHTIGVKVGFGWTFGRVQMSSSDQKGTEVSKLKVDSAETPDATATPAIQPTATLVSTPTAKGTPVVGIPATYIWVEGDNLRVLAKKFYGESYLYTLIVDANADKIRRPTQLVAGVVLTIPQTVTSADKADARVKNRQDGYRLWGKWGAKKQ
jgi:hypothetical protein